MMPHTGKNQSGLRTLALGITVCLAFLLAVVFFGPQTVRAETVTVDTLEVAFGKAGVGDSLASVMDFKDKTAKTLNVPAGASYTAKLTMVCRDGQRENLWTNSNSSLSWDRVENQLIEQNVAYCIRVLFEPKTGYRLSDDAKVLKQNLRVLGAELGKGKDIEFWDIAGRNTKTSAVEMDFVLSKGMTYIGYPAIVSPAIGIPVTGKIGTLYTDTGIWLRGAPGPYNYTVKTAPVGMELQVSNVFEESTCYYRITAVNAMDAGTMYITATASDGQTCDIPVSVTAVSGGHEHTWSDFGKIDFAHHGYRQCTDPGCPGVSPTFDKGSQYAGHAFYSGCNASCKMCGNLGNPDATHSFSAAPDETDNTCHVYKCACGEVEKDADGSVRKENHAGGVQTCLSGAQCEACGYEYLAATGHKYEFRSFGNNDGTYTHLGFCKYCGTENAELRHAPTGGTATCRARAKCTYIHNGDVCGCEYGDFEAHHFVEGICTVCSSDEYIRRVVIDVPEFYEGMAYTPMFYPNVIEGNVIPRGLYFYKVSSDRNGSDTLCNASDCGSVFITNNSVMFYVFRPHTTCKFPASIDDIHVSVTHGEVLSKQIRESDGNLIVMVLLRVEGAVQSLDIEVSQPLAGYLPETLKITEKNGCSVTVDQSSIGPLVDGVFYKDVPCEVKFTVRAPEGKIFPVLKPYDIKNWLCDYSISGGTLMRYEQSTDRTEVTFIIQTRKPVDCLHENVTLKAAGRLESCTEDGVKDKYACVGCGKEFFDAACTMPWDDAAAIIPKGHLCFLHEATPCTEGKDGNIAYYECRREACGKLFTDAACTKEITQEETVLHDFKAEWSSTGEEHFRECKNCDRTNDKAPHRPDRAAATEDSPVKCLDCGYIITPALGHIHKTTLVAGTDATCMKKGSKPYYRCSGCEVKFEDKEATRPIADESTLVIDKAHRFGEWVKEVPATEAAFGVRGHKDCVFCGKHFDESGAEIADLSIAKLVKAEITVVGGTGGGRFAIGETVTVTADAPAAGKVFRGWKDAGGKLVSTEKRYTFTVTGQTSLTAVYENSAPEGKDEEEMPSAADGDGLSGGAIAGIAVGSAAVAGLGGFAIFWFAIRKKSIAELIAALKRIGRKG